MKSYLTIGGIAMVMMSCSAAPPGADAGDPTVAESPPAPAPQPGPSAGPQPEPPAAPLPGPAAVPQPEPSTAPQPGPTAAPQPGPTTAPQPGPTTAPQPEPTVAPQPGPTATSRTVWDGVYTLAQAERGQGIAQEQCSICHSAEGEWPVLFGLWTGRSLVEPFTTIRMTMPQTNPGGLQRSEYAAVMAYILQLNGAPAGSTDLPGDDDALGRIMVTRR